MNKQHSSEMQSIRKKLIAAIAMLLVAVIMTVSSTYAWFTLSTAPEVKGITTTVGANGNLEIALGTYETVYKSPLDPVGSGEGTSMDKAGVSKTVANVTWGNLVDLSDVSYGLSAITLFPTRLNVVENMIKTGSPLRFPLYGTDGRIIELSDGTILGKYADTTSGFKGDTSNFKPNGVSAIGYASDMSEREFAVRNNKNFVLTYRNYAKEDAVAAISDYAGDLAALALNEPQDTAVVDVTKLRALIDRLQDANADIANSYKSAILVSLACNTELTDDAWETAAGTLASMSLDEILESDITPEAAKNLLTSYLTDYNELKTTLGNADEALNDDTKTEYLWSDVKSIVSNLLVASEIKLGSSTENYTITQIQADRADDNKEGIVQKLINIGMSGDLRFIFGANSGVFAKVAKMTGSYSSYINFPEGTEVEGIPVAGRPWPVDVIGDPTVGTIQGLYGILTGKTEGVDDFKAPTATGSEKALTDTYGYTVDMIFRTNAADSFLQLQTKAANRIYSDDDNTALMGGGSNMSFTLNGEYTAEKINGIAEGIRVVFYETPSAVGGDATILGVATLDTESGRTEGTNYKLDLKLVNYTFDTETVEGKTVATKINIGDAKTDISLCALAANTQQNVTALVYLDGDVIDNADIAAAADLNGVLNLQFSSSATLTPMDNNALKNTVTDAE